MTYEKVESNLYEYANDLIESYRTAYGQDNALCKLIAEDAEKLIGTMRHCIHVLDLNMPHLNSIIIEDELEEREPPLLTVV